MYRSESKLVNGLLIVGTVLGLIASIITIWALIVSDGPLLVPLGIDALNEVASWARSLGDNWTFGPLATALGVYGLVTAITFASEKWEEPTEYVGMLLLLFPLPGAWIWLFFDLVNTSTVVWFAVGYATVPWLTVAVPAMVAFLVSEWAEDRSALVGIARNVEKKSARFLNHERVWYTLILDRDGDVPAKVELHGWMIRHEPKSGVHVKVSGRWRRGVFHASSVEPSKEALDS